MFDFESNDDFRFALRFSFFEIKLIRSTGREARRSERYPDLVTRANLSLSLSLVSAGKRNPVSVIRQIRIRVVAKHLIEHVREIKRDLR